jgi:hypothetical protein
VVLMTHYDELLYLLLIVLLIVLIVGAIPRR